MEERDPTGHEQMLQFLAGGAYDHRRLRQGELCDATVLAVSEMEIIVDVGVKRDGVVQRADLERVEAEHRASIKVGDSIPVCVLTTSNQDGELIVSLSQGLQQGDWLRALEMLDSKEICEAEVIEVNRGGVIVEFGKLRGFVPNSLLTVVPRSCPMPRRDEIKADLIGETLALGVIEVNRERRKLVLSQRDAERQQRRGLLDELTEGETRTGIVRNLTDFGAFVDLGGFDGLIHVSEMDWQHVNHPSDILSVGDEVQVYVMEVDRRRDRVGLSRRRLLPDPWQQVTSTIELGQAIEGRVSSVADFGLFVEIATGVDGLVHASEIPEGEYVWRELPAGAPLTVRVISVDQRRRRIGLSLRNIEDQALALPLPEPSTVAAVESDATGENGVISDSVSMGPIVL